MTVHAWVHTFCPEKVLPKDAVVTCLKRGGITPIKLDTNKQQGPGIVILDQVNSDIREFIRTLSLGKSQRILIMAANGLSDDHTWQLLEAGASDVLSWPTLKNPGSVIAARLKRWQKIDDLICSPLVRNNLVGRSQTWMSVLRRIVEAARFTDAPVLLMGETGTGKELAARLIHSLDKQRNKHELVILDCTTIVPDLSGSELFGHERGAFTGAVSARDGAFALADGGTLFLDEVGELPPGLQVQLLRVLQEHTYKRVGSNTWRKSDFRLLCATNRDLRVEESKSRFRRDLYYRLANWSIRLPPLRKRLDDIIPLVQHFVRQANPDGEPHELDDKVKAYFLTRKYPGNVRDLQNLVSRIMARHVGPGPITVGDIPVDERPEATPAGENWCDNGTEQAIRQAIAAGQGLQDVRRSVEETAIRVAIEDEDGDLHRAASRLGVTVRTIQNRRAQYRKKDKAIVNNGR
jgi:DNA-binding NtrC family response regulator